MDPGIYPGNTERKVGIRPGVYVLMGFSFVPFETSGFLNLKYASIFL